jgi:hypothetical protein
MMEGQMDDRFSVGSRVASQPPSSDVLRRQTFTHPDQVVADPSLSISTKREILASWASDARAVSDDLRLRRLDSGADVPVREILAALRTLAGDQPALDPSCRLPMTAFARRRRTACGRLRRRSSPDDNDPPPLPSLAAFARLAA